MSRVWSGADNDQPESGLYRGSGIHRSEGGEECSVLSIPTPRGSLQSIINTSKHAIVYTTSHGALNFERNTVIELFKCPPPVSVRLQFEPQWEFNFDNYQAKLDFHWWAVSESCCQVSAGENHQAGNSPIWDNSRVKITVQIVSNPYFSWAQPTSIAIKVPPPYRGGAGKCVVWSKQ